jgi:hypothetical protein
MLKVLTDTRPGRGDNPPSDAMKLLIRLDIPGGNCGASAPVVKPKATDRIVTGLDCGGGISTGVPTSAGRGGGACGFAGG